MDFIKNNVEFDLISFGEVMLRLSPPDKEKISQSEVFEKNCGGSEFNVASGAANLGIRSAIKNTVSGDMSISSIDEVNSVISSHRETGIQDEMVR